MICSVRYAVIMPSKYSECSAMAVDYCCMCHGLGADRNGDGIRQYLPRLPILTGCSSKRQSFICKQPEDLPPLPPVDALLIRASFAAVSFICFASLPPTTARRTMSQCVTRDATCRWQKWLPYLHTSILPIGGTSTGNTFFIIPALRIRTNWRWRRRWTRWWRRRRSQI